MLPGRVTFRGQAQAVYVGESLAQTLRQLDAYGRDGLPVLSGDGQQAQGWITNDSVLRAIAREIGSAPPQSTHPRAARTSPGQPVLEASSVEPPDPLPGYEVLEVTIGTDSPAVGKAMSTISWPEDYLPVSVLHQRTLQEPDPDWVLALGDRISVLAPRAP
jgi:CIC family chloride channel protein